MSSNHSKTDVVVKLVLVFFISLLSFSIGTFVGKKFSDNQHKLAQFEPGSEENASRDVASVDAHGGKKDQDKNADHSLSEQEITDLAQEFIADNIDQASPSEEDSSAIDTHLAKGHIPSNEVPKSSNAHDSPNHEPKAVKATTAPHSPATTEPDDTAMSVSKKSSKAYSKIDSAHEKSALPIAEKFSKGQNLQAEVKKESKKSTSYAKGDLPKQLAASAEGKYTVQVSSFPDEKEAQKLTSSLQSKGFSSFYTSVQIKDKTWYRVNVGLFNNSSDANEFKKEFLNKSQMTSAIIQKVKERMPAQNH